MGDKDLAKVGIEVEIGDSVRVVVRARETVGVAVEGKQIFKGATKDGHVYSTALLIDF